MKKAWEKRDHPSMLFVHYGDIKLNPKAEISRIQKFRGNKEGDAKRGKEEEKTDKKRCQ